MAKNENKPSDYVPTEADLLIKEVIRAIDDLPILERLQFAKNLLEVNGGNLDAFDQNPQLVVVTGVLFDVIKVLNKHPSAARLRSPDVGPT